MPFITQSFIFSSKIQQNTLYFGVLDCQHMQDSKGRPNCNHHDVVYEIIVSQIWLGLARSQVGHLKNPNN